MIVAFCGHRDLIITPQIENKLTDTVSNILKAEPNSLFYLGGYGNFDRLCNGILRKLQKNYPLLKRVFITPYLNPEYSKLKTAKDDYDEIIYPFEQAVIPKYAIIKRNKWIVDSCNLLIACVNLRWGGAYNTFKYAVKKGKPYLNLGQLSF